ncbi:acyltransferase [Caballeronia sp. LZ032]|uniref:acyltransferase family protein n=1 Tax=Caballeronia sp. LZ032 TaxID=3038565 RepID=UPI00285515A8|nr:acyltransferase [Caballeronia sp. LZ032]MDR5881858.1 acyltransferase [Caballeronia sp. LZ032]
MTGLRGVAALWVVVHHMLLLAPLPASLDTLVHHGYLAVDIFFMLSGFVMSLTYERMFRTRLLGRGYAIFLLRRLARVYPLYVVTLLAVAALNLAGFSHSWSGGFANFVFNVLMIHGWGFYDSINSPAWSISTEFAAYLLFPAFTLLVLRQRWLRIASVTLFIAGIALMSCVSLHQGAQNGPLDIANEATIFPLLRCLCEFGIGMAVYVAARDPRIAKACSGKLVSAFIVIALLACLLTPGSDLVVVLATPFVIVIAATSRKAPVSRFLGSAPVFFLGEISYAMYLLHSQFLRIYRLGPLILERHHMPHTLALLITVAALFGSLITASYLAFRYLEVPARNAIRRLEGRLQPRVANAVAVQS